MVLVTCLSLLVKDTKMLVYYARKNVYCEAGLFDGKEDKNKVKGEATIRSNL